MARYRQIFNERTRAIEPFVDASGRSVSKTSAQLAKAVALRKAALRKWDDPYVRGRLNESLLTGSGPQVDGMYVHDKLGGNLSTDKDLNFNDPTGYVFMANSLACPECLRYDGTWFGHPMMADLVSHKNCRCAIVPATQYEDLVRKGRAFAGKNMTTFGEDRETAMQNAPDNGNPYKTPFQRQYGKRKNWIPDAEE